MSARITVNLNLVTLISILTLRRNLIENVSLCLSLENWNCFRIHVMKSFVFESFRFCYVSRSILVTI